MMWLVLFNKWRPKSADSVSSRTIYVYLFLLISPLYQPIAFRAKLWLTDSTHPYFLFSAIALSGSLHKWGKLHCSPKTLNSLNFNLRRNQCFFVITTCSALLLKNPLRFCYENNRIPVIHYQVLFTGAFLFLRVSLQFKSRALFKTGFSHQWMSLNRVHD